MEINEQTRPNRNEVKMNEHQFERLIEAVKETKVNLFWPSFWLYLIWLAVLIHK